MAPLSVFEPAGLGLWSAFVLVALLGSSAVHPKALRQNPESQDPVFSWKNSCQSMYSVVCKKASTYAQFIEAADESDHLLLRCCSSFSWMRAGRKPAFTLGVSGSLGFCTIESLTCSLWFPCYIGVVRLTWKSLALETARLHHEIALKQATVISPPSIIARTDRNCYEFVAPQCFSCSLFLSGTP
jgi:hypothetical protein